MTTATKSIRESLSQARRAAGQRSFRVFCQTYLPGYFKDPPSSMHEELFGLLAEATSQRGARLALAAPRGHAKTSIVSTAYTLWCICYGLEPYMVLVSNTADQARDLLSHIKRELESNTRLLEDFPELSESSQVPGPPRWRKDEIITRNDIKVTAVGVGGSVRGRKHRQHRPTLVILDDIENETEVRSPDQRERLNEWFSKAILKLGSATTNLILVGTILHYDSLLARLVDPAKTPGWTARVYKAVIRWSERQDLWQSWETIYKGLEEHEGDTGPKAAKAFFDTSKAEMLEGTSVLWPQREGYLALMEIRVREGRASFDSEKQNEPTNPEDCLFRESDFVFWDDQFACEQDLINAIGGNAVFYGACDPSLGRKGRQHDDTAIVSIVKDQSTGVMYVVDADLRKRKPDDVLDTAIAYNQRRKYQKFAFESNQFQDFLADEFIARSRARGRQVPVEKVAHTSDKILRIQTLQPLVSAGTIRFCRKQVALLEQLRQFPHAAHDDGPDALEMAVDAAKGVEFSVSVIYPGMWRVGFSQEERLRGFMTGADIAERERVWRSPYRQMGL
jgi:predicted phage terminase large subunit-like protein